MRKYPSYIIQMICLLLAISCHPTPKLSGQFTNAEFVDMTMSMSEGGTPDITVDEVKDELIKYTLLDARELEEYNVSHIPGSLWVGYEDFTTDRLNAIDRSTHIVVYCSVGYRSERIGEKLLEAGFLHVKNLRGSIFEWVNKNLPIVDISNQPTNKIHGYNKTWSRWLKNGDVVY